jgi:cyclic pyranopterin phosphate synthase
MLRVRDGLKDGLGRPVTYLRISVTEHCSLACGSCEPRTEGHGPKAMSRNEIVRLVKVFTSLGIRKIHLIGGEPMHRRDLETIIAGLSPEVEGRVHLTTNGINLARRARALRDAGLSGVNVNLDAVDPDAFAGLARKNGLDKVRAGLEAARVAGLNTMVNAVILRGWNEDQVLPLAHLAQQDGFQVRFIEFKPHHDSVWGTNQFVPATEILRTIQDGLGTSLEEEPQIRREEDPTRLYRIPGSLGKVGIISTLGTGVCDHCNRVRLTSCGHLQACLFGPNPIDLLTPLRNHASHEDLVRLIRGTLTSKQNCHPRRPGDHPRNVHGLRKVGG